MPSNHVAIIGAGSWGSAVAWLLGEKGINTRIWARNADLARAITDDHRNPGYLADIRFAPPVTATDVLAEAVDAAESVILATPSSVLLSVAARLAPLLPHTTPLLVLSKGLDLQSGRPLSEPLTDVLGNAERLAVLSGPNHAEEVSRAMPSATVVASVSNKTACYFQELLATSAFRVYTSPDTLGVQLCGATKNVIAIACGLAVGLGYGDNTTAMLMTRGLAEISRLVIALGGDVRSCMGLAGMGDLIATCTSPHSRNRSFGLELAQGGSLDVYQSRTHMVVEGAVAARTVNALAAALRVELPICSAVLDIVWEGGELGEVIQALSSRELKPEFY
ncbi:MAG: NAD(P)-dependent glycerol-3-phosphate dehydrogenase [Actinomycetia bacterium]|nr:NAD(P)-dependent glycerol-3-phosphate dehydrogenase [Actinomycetes bacterium]